MPQLIKTIAELLVHIAQRLHQGIDLGSAGSGKAGLCACCYGASRCADGDEWLCDRATGCERQQTSEKERQQSGAPNGALGSADYGVNLIQTGSDPHHPSSSRNGHIEKRMTHARTSAARYASVTRQRCSHLGPL